jgi:hypothetical protein
MESSHEPPHTIHFFIDKAPFETTTPSHTVRDLIVNFAKEDPAQVTLIQVKGDERIKHPDLNETLEVTNGEHFLIFHNTPTTVS